MTTDPTAVMQEAIIAAVRADPALPDIHDPVPAQPVWPYVALAEINSKPAGAEGYDASEVLVVLHIWTDDEGSHRAKQVIAALTQALDNEIAIEGFRVVIHEPLRAASGNPVEDGPNGILTMRYKVQALA